MNEIARARKFWDKQAERYIAGPMADPAGYEATLTQTVSHFDASDRILEIGCGSGATARRLAQHVAHVTATDISPEMIRIASDRTGGEGPENVTYKVAGALDRVDGEPFDHVCAFNCLHLLVDVPAALRHIRGQLKPGGLLISKTDCLNDRSLAYRGLVRMVSLLGVAPPFSALSAESLRELHVAARFEIVDIRFFDRKQLRPYIVARKPEH